MPVIPNAGQDFVGPTQIQFECNNTNQVNCIVTVYHTPIADKENDPHPMSYNLAPSATQQLNVPNDRTYSVVPTQGVVNYYYIDPIED